MGALNAPQNIETAVYLIESGRKSPAMACRETNSNPYDVEEARRKLGPKHRFDSKKGLYTTKGSIWVRKCR